MSRTFRGPKAPNRRLSEASRLPTKRPSRHEGRQDPRFDWRLGLEDLGVAEETMEAIYGLRKGAE